MIAEVIRKDQKCSDSNAEEAVKHWQKVATDRKGGRKRRAKNNMD